MPTPHIRAGDLRNRIDFITSATVTDEATGLPETGEKVFAANVWAAIGGVTAMDLFQAQQYTKQVTHKVTIRYRRGILSSMRIRFRGRMFEIQGVVNVEERNVRLDIFCIERNDGQ